MSDSFSQRALSEIAEQQARWAELREIDVDRDGATLRLEDNFFEPLSQAAEGALFAATAQGCAAPTKPQSLARLDSTDALIANVFDHWTGRDCAPLLDALIGSERESTLEWVQPAPRHTGSEVSIAADLFLNADNGANARPVAIVATFTEPYLAGGAGRAPAFPGFRDPGVWGSLQGCRNLALDRASNTSRFQRLAVSPMLERCLALYARFGNRGFQLVHLWYEVPGHAALQMHREIDRFRMRVGGEIDFVSLTWQEFFARLAARAGDHKGYADRLSARYFPG